MFPSRSCVFMMFLHAVLGQTDEIICPNGWERFESSCYLYEDVLFMDWTEGTHYCSAHHQSTLAVIDSREEDQMLTDFLQKLYKPGSNHNVWFWLGGSDAEIEGIWKWYTDDRPFTSGYVNWTPGQPDNKVSEDCLCKWGPWNFVAWDDCFCMKKSHVICEKNHTITAVDIIG